jgi:hypothetical protein
MARTSTALTAVRMALEANRGGQLGVSAASPNWFYPWADSFEVAPESSILQPRHLTGDRHLRLPVRGEYVVPGRGTFDVGPENFAQLLYGIFSEVATSAHTSNVTTQYTFTMGTTQPSFEAQVDKGYMETWDTGGFIGAMALNVDRNAILKADVDFRFQQEGIVTAGTFPTPTYSALDPFTDMKGTMERDDGAVTDMDGFSLSINSAPLDFKRFGSQWFTDVLFGKSEITWELGCSFADDTEFRRFLGDSTDTGQQNIGDRYQTVKVEWEFQTGQTPAQTVTNYYLKLTAYGALYPNFPQGISSDSELLRSRPQAIVRYDASQGYALDIALFSAISDVFT